MVELKKIVPDRQVNRVSVDGVGVFGGASDAHYGRS